MDMKERVREIIVEQLAVDLKEVGDDTTIESLGADLLDHLELIIALEEEFQMEIADEIAEKIISLQTAVDCLVELGAK